MQPFSTLVDKVARDEQYLEATLAQVGGRQVAGLAGRVLGPAARDKE
jgi:hypothetical protein